ncbi:MAG TPA: cytochrome c [Steroidobacteraceae bacterium]|nr:cytochrome c [Steroidobacteraceae bacterium]
MKRAIVVMLALVAIALGIVIARNGPSADEQAVDYRQALMTVIDNVTEPLFRMQRGQLTYNSALVGKRSMQLAVLSGMVGDAFARDTRSSSHLQTAALPYVWSDPRSFAAAVQRMQKAAAALQRSTLSEDSAHVQPMIQALDSDCAQCHRQFRAN